MGTETSDNIFLFLPLIGTLVKLNNPLMGTETVALVILDPFSTLSSVLN